LKMMSRYRSLYSLCGMSWKRKKKYMAKISLRSFSTPFNRLWAMTSKQMTHHKTPLSF
jgi:hypothetical protein